MVKTRITTKMTVYIVQIMLEATSQFYQGGATASQVKMASYAEKEAAKSQSEFGVYGCSGPN